MSAGSDGNKCIGLRGKMVFRPTIRGLLSAALHVLTAKTVRKVQINSAVYHARRVEM